jgi:hypothetical protein
MSEADLFRGVRQGGHKRVLQATNEDEKRSLIDLCKKRNPRDRPARIRFDPSDNRKWLGRR